VNKLLALAVRHKAVAVVGLAKNTGKTVTVNYLVSAASHLNLGLTSTGRDGETLDILSAEPKPSIYLPRGTVLATAKDSLRRGTARLEILAATGLSNALGEIVLARVREAGTVEISGPERTVDLKKTIALLKQRADLVIVDGAMDRIAASAPTVTDAVILATGAVVGRDLQTVVRETVHVAHLLMCPEAESLSAEARGLVASGRIGLQDSRGNVRALDLPTAVHAPLELLDYLDLEHRRLLLGGALTDEMAELLLSASRRNRGMEVIIKDGTRIFVQPVRWQKLLRAGVKVRALKAMELLAVTVNPFDPWGRQLPGPQLVESLRKLLPGLLVLDPLGEGGS